MSTILNAPPHLKPTAQSIIAEWWPVILGLLVMYVPTYYGLANGIWNTEEQAHGPIVLVILLWMLWEKRAVFLAPAERTSPISGGVLLVFGLLLYILGRSQDIFIFEVGSQIHVLAGLLLATKGGRAVKALWFPLLFIIFLIPLPGFFVDVLTGPLKQYVSVLAEQMLYTAGYPIARNGVVLTIGSYQLLVADACSGLHSMYSLSAMGLLYMYLMKHTSWLRNGLLLISIWPIAFAANVIRVMVLVLITYHLGDEAGQGFLHGFAGIALFVISLLFLFALDAVLGWILPDSKSKNPKAA
jgi:exosortase B